MDSYGFTSGATGDASMASNLLKIQVYFTSLNVETIAESPTYQVIFSLCNEEIKNLTSLLHSVVRWIIHIRSGWCHIPLPRYLHCNDVWGWRALHWLLHKLLHAEEQEAHEKCSQGSSHIIWHEHSSYAVPLLFNSLSEILHCYVSSFLTIKFIRQRICRAVDMKCKHQLKGAFLKIPINKEYLTSKFTWIHNFK